MNTPSFIELLLLARHDCGQPTVPCVELAGILRDRPALLLHCDASSIGSAWRGAVAQQLMALNVPPAIAWRVAAQHPGHQHRITIKELAE